jgi:mannose-6-phosphate isomerase-like protein (cupin superfamily)
MIITAPRSPTHAIGTTHFTALVAPSTGSTQTSVWTIEIEPRTPLGEQHTVTREEVFVVLTGEASVHLGDDVVAARPGDAIIVPADVPFALGNDGEQSVRLVCCLPVGGQARLADGTTFVPPWAA